MSALQWQLFAGLGKVRIKVRTSRNAVEAVAELHQGGRATLEFGRVSAVRSARLTSEGADLKNEWWPARPVFVVEMSIVHRQYGHRGVGLAMYRAVAEAVWNQHGAVLMAHDCEREGHTSEAAQQVWAKLATIYPSYQRRGDCHALLGSVPR